MELIPHPTVRGGHFGEIPLTPPALRLRLYRLSGLAGLRAGSRFSAMVSAGIPIRIVAAFAPPIIRECFR